MQMCAQCEAYNASILGVTNINVKGNKFGYHMKNTWDIVNIIDVQILGETDEYV